MKWKGCVKEQSWSNLRYDPSICLKELRKNTKNLSQDSRSLSRNSNPRPLEYEAGVLSS
jgi:hypothetical protein